MARGKTKNIRRHNRSKQTGKKTNVLSSGGNIQTNGKKYKKNEILSFDSLVSDIAYQGKIYRVEYTADEIMGQLHIKTVADLDRALRTHNISMKLDCIITDDNIINAVGQLLMDKLNNQYNK